jgi:hypothetical protein
MRCPRDNANPESAFGCRSSGATRRGETGTIARSVAAAASQARRWVFPSVDIAIIDDDGAFVDRNVAGEIVVMGTGM